MMKDLKNRKLIVAKGFLFVVLGLMASGILLFRVPDLSVAALHFIAIWAFCRFYYFAFYVIEHYVDPSFRFTGLTSFVMYMAGFRANSNSDDVR